MIYILLADGFEEIEALTPLDMLRRVNAPVKTVSITERREVVGAHGITVLADLTFTDDLEKASLLVLPGGMPGAANLDASAFVSALIKETAEGGGHLAAICAAPMVLGHQGYLAGKRATCFPGFEEYLTGATVGGKVIRDGKIITAAGMGVAQEFGLEMISALVSPEKAGEIRAAIQSL